MAITLVFTGTVTSFNNVNTKAAGSGIDFTHLANALPINSASDGSISICVTNKTTNEQTPILQLAKQASNSVDLPVGNYSIYVTSLTRSSADGHIWNPCTEHNPEYVDWIVWLYDTEVKDNQRTIFNFTGTGSIEDPRLDPNYPNLTPFTRKDDYQSSGLISIGFGGYFVDENGTRHNSPLSALNKVCIDRGSDLDAELVDLVQDGFNNLALFKDIGIPNGGIRFFPPLIDGTCGTQDIWTTPFTQFVEPVFGPTENFTIRFADNPKITGFSANITFTGITPQTSSSSSSSSSIPLSKASNVVYGYMTPQSSSSVSSALSSISSSSLGSVSSSSVSSASLISSVSSSLTVAVVYLEVPVSGKGITIRTDPIN